VAVVAVEARQPRVVQCLILVNSLQAIRVRACDRSVLHFTHDLGVRRRVHRVDQVGRRYAACDLGHSVPVAVVNDGQLVSSRKSTLSHFSFPQSRGGGVTPIRFNATRAAPADVISFSSTQSVSRITFKGEGQLLLRGGLDFPTPLRPRRAQNRSKYPAEKPCRRGSYHQPFLDQSFPSVEIGVQQRLLRAGRSVHLTHFRDRFSKLFQSPRII